MRVFESFFSQFDKITTIIKNLLLTKHYTKILNEVNGLVISILMLTGIALIAPLFRSIKKSEQELKLYSENLEKLVDQRTAQMMQTSKLASLGTFAAGVAHEKRQYMQAVRSNAERILAVREKYEKAYDFKGYLEFVEDRVKSIQQSINASNSLINSLLSYSKGDPELYTNVSIKDQIELTLNIITHSIKQDNIEISREIQDSQEIFGNEMQIREIIMNLLTNAHHAVRNSKNETKKINICLNNDNDNVYLIVEDNGIGMTIEEQKQAFDPFFTTKSPQEGVGLGLSLVSKYVENHKGKIEFKSKKDEGTTFRIIFPIKRDK
jgi:two-component system NtrC family sensor kinase